ncbi:putative F-box protein [Cardamine amara subsp. amara]|uniref:F-box protein n=1 Tax=Cardamine amara subsp. amara TaxID=228776 RepID=A0ABD1B5P8_CARAN
MEGFGGLNIAGATCGGEIVFVIKLSRCCKTLYVSYYGPKRNSLRYVQVEGTMVEETDHIHHYRNRIWAVMDHVDNTMRL